MTGDTLDLEHTIVVAAPAAEAFEHFVDRLSAWWPREYTWSQTLLDRISIAATVGGRCTERAAGGFEIDFGRVLDIERPTRIVFAWCIGPDRVPIADIDRAGRVDVRVDAAGPGRSRLTLRHTHFERYGDGGASYRDVMASDYGWRYILQRYAASFGAQT